MAKPLISDRLKFNRKGTQALFITQSKETSSLTWNLFAKKIKVNQRTLFSWREEKIRMSVNAALKISKLTKFPIPKDYSIVRWNDHLRSISKSGGRAVVNKYGKVSFDEEHRKEIWKRWWNTIGRYKKPNKGFQSIIKIKTPTKNDLLAEFVGVMLGDGGINKYCTSVTLSSAEKQYVVFVSQTINKLFGVKPKIYKRTEAKAVSIVVNRKQLVSFCQKIGLVQGNKIRQQIDIPQWIKENKQFSKACIRGLVDTDGCFYSNSYYVNNKKYSYFKICFTSASIPLIQSVHNILLDLGMRAIISRNYREVRIVDSKSVDQYIKIIGTNNNKHFRKIEKWKNDKNMIE